jgi:hypothetical protein
MSVLRVVYTPPGAAFDSVHTGSRYALAQRFHLTPELYDALLTSGATDLPCGGRLEVIGEPVRGER